MHTPLDVVLLGLSITSSYDNEQALTYRGLVRELARLGHHVTFLEREDSWHSSERDLPEPPYGVTRLYSDLSDLQNRFASTIEGADVIIVGSHLIEGIDIAEWVLNESHGFRIFYDHNTPETLRLLKEHRCPYLDFDMIPFFDLYLSSTGGPILLFLEEVYGAKRARPLLHLTETCHAAQYHARDLISYLDDFLPVELTGPKETALNPGIFLQGL